MAISQKRPFGINVEDKKRRIVDVVVKFGRDNVSIGEIETIKRWSYWDKCYEDETGRDITTSCPVCKKRITYFNTGWAFINRDLKEDMPDERYYARAYEMLSGHIKTQIRLEGCQKHMQLILDIFGDRDGMEILDMFAKKNLLVAKAICDFINSKLVTNDVNVGVSE